MPIANQLLYRRITSHCSPSEFCSDDFVDIYNGSAAKTARNRVSLELNYLEAAGLIHIARIENRKKFYQLTM